MPSADHRVETRRLVKAFGTFRAVDDVTIAVRPGEIFGFLGSNGAGKTTTIRILCGLLRPTSGEAWVNGINVARDPEGVRSNIGYMSQHFSLYNELTVDQNLNFFSGIYGVSPGVREERAHQILALFELTERRRQLTAILPAGVKQRLALACAVLHEPAVLFLDEPTSGVDPQARRAFWELIRRLAESGKTIFVSTHNMDEASYCDRLALMHQGRIIALDTPDGLLRLLAAGERLIALSCREPVRCIETLTGSEFVSEAWIAGRGVNVLLREGSTSRQVVEVLRSRNLCAESLGPVPPSIEDVFVSLIEAEEERIR